MSKIVFFCIPAHGHTNPTLPVVRELVSRGHEVTYYSYEMMRRKIEEAGAAFIPCDAFDAEMKLSPQEAARLGSDLALSTRVLTDSTLALDDVVCRHMAALRPDCIVADSMAVWGKAVAMKLNIPFVSSTTTFAFNQHSARILKRSLKELFAFLFSMPKVNRQLKRLQQRGFPIRNVLDLIQNDDRTHTIVYTSYQFQPFSETFSNRYAFVGPCIRSASAVIEKTHTKMVYISLGTVNNDQLAFYRQCIQAFSDGAYQVILSVGHLTDLEALSPLPANVSVHTQVDQIAVLEKADVFLSHCGMNSVSESLYFGVPLILYPQTTEQKGVALRTEQLGAGLRLLKADAASIRAAVDRVLAEPSYRTAAEAIARGFRSCNGAKGAADKILSLCSK